MRRASALSMPRRRLATCFFWAFRRTVPPRMSLREWKAPLPDGAEALTVWRGNYQGKPAVILCGADARGLMYAALDVADRVGWAREAAIRSAKCATPPKSRYLAERGISIYTMQRAYFESRFYDEQYWERYFDMLAASRINSFVVIFGYENGGFLAPLYPYFFDVGGFPGVELVGLTREQQEPQPGRVQAR